MIKLNYFLIPLFTVLVAVGGSSLTSGGMTWYQAIHKPAWTPPGSTIGLVWTVIFILATVAALLVWNAAGRVTLLPWIAGLFIANGVLNALWSYLFFTKHLMTVAGFEAGLLCLTVVALMILIWPVSRLACGLLLPYAGWTAFATYLTFTVASLNK